AGISRLCLRLVFKRSLSVNALWAVFWTLAFLAGAAATTPLSLWRNEFVFTWPASVFAAFQATLFHVRLARNESPVSNQPWHSRTVALVFLAVCVVYYILCRRLSLVFEWVFLSGFAAAIPVALVGLWLSRRSRRPLLYNVLFTAASFAAY